MIRIPETTEIMSDVDQCVVYNKYASEINSLNEYVDLYSLLIGITSGTVLDLGSGSCNFVVALANRYKNLKFICYEKSEAMLSIAKENIKGLEDRIVLIQDDIRNVAGTYDVVLANRVFHHFANPLEFWSIIDSLDTTFLIVDINRPADETIKELKLLSDIDPIYKEDLINSICAAWNVDEVIEQIKPNSYIVKSINNNKLVIYQIK